MTQSTRQYPETFEVKPGDIVRLHGNTCDYVVFSVNTLSCPEVPAYITDPNRRFVTLVNTEFGTSYDAPRLLPSDGKITLKDLLSTADIGEVREVSRRGRVVPPPVDLEAPVGSFKKIKATGMFTGLSYSYAIEPTSSGRYVVLVPDRGTAGMSPVLFEAGVPLGEAVRRLSCKDPSVE
jgi:hypothetical protein